MLTIAVLQVILYLLFWFMLRLDAAVIRPRIEVAASFIVGENEPLSLTLNLKRRTFVLGALDVQITWKNAMTGETGRKTIRILIDEKRHQWQLPLEIPTCGQVIIPKIKLRGYDIFGLCGVYLERMTGLRTLGIPPACPLHVQRQLEGNGQMQEEKEPLARRGQEPSEVFDLREYRPGDSLHSIHWKLSSKTEEFVVKEAGDVLHTDILFVFDMNKETLVDAEGQALFVHMVSFCMEVCDNFITGKEWFAVAVPCAGEIYMKEITSKENYEELVNDWLGMEIPAARESGRQYLSIKSYGKNFSYIFYVTDGGVSEEVFSINEHAQVCAVTIVREGNQVRHTQKEQGQIIEIPYKLLEEEGRMLRI